jgi:hypothetical protein
MGAKPSVPLRNFLPDVIVNIVLAYDPICLTTLVYPPPKEGCECTRVMFPECKQHQHTHLCAKCTFKPHHLVIREATQNLVVENVYCAITDAAIQKFLYNPSAEALSPECASFSECVMYYENCYFLDEDYSNLIHSLSFRLTDEKLPTHTMLWSRRRDVLNFIHTLVLGIDNPNQANSVHRLGLLQRTDVEPLIKTIMEAYYARCREYGHRKSSNFGLTRHITVISNRTYTRGRDSRSTPIHSRQNPGHHPLGMLLPAVALIRQLGR